MKLRKIFVVLLALVCLMGFGLSYNKVEANKVEVVSQTATYTVSSKTSVSVTGAPEGSSASFENTYSTKEQLIKGNSMTLTLKGYNGYKINSLTLSMKSNKSGGSGNLSYTNGSANTVYVVGDSTSGEAFNAKDWYGNWSQTYVNVDKTFAEAIVVNGDLTFKIVSFANSIYCQSFTLSYELADTSSATLDSIEIDETTITSKEVFAGETYSTSGIKVYGKYSDNTRKEITPSWSVDTSTVGDSIPVTASYLGKTDSFTIKVKEKTLTSIAVTTQPTKTEYYTNDKIDLRGMVITASYDNNTSSLYEDYTISPSVAPATAGSFTVTISSKENPEIQTTVQLTAKTFTPAYEIEDGAKYYITVTHNNVNYVLKAGEFAAKESGLMTAMYSSESQLNPEWGWTFTNVGNDLYEISCGTNKLYTTSANNGLVCGTGSNESYDFKLTYKDNVLNLMYTDTKRYLTLYSSGASYDFRSYESSYGSGSDPQNSCITLIKVPEFNPQTLTNSFSNENAKASLLLEGTEENITGCKVRFGGVISYLSFNSQAKYGVLVLTEELANTSLTADDINTHKTNKTAIECTPVEVSGGYQFAWVINNISQEDYDRPIYVYMYMVYDGNVYLTQASSYTVNDIIFHYSVYGLDLGLSEAVIKYLDNIYYDPKQGGQQ